MEYREGPWTLPPCYVKYIIMHIPRISGVELKSGNGSSRVPGEHNAVNEQSVCKNVK